MHIKFISWKYSYPLLGGPLVIPRRGRMRKSQKSNYIFKGEVDIDIISRFLWFLDGFERGIEFSETVHLCYMWSWVCIGQAGNDENMSVQDTCWYRCLCLKVIDRTTGSPEFKKCSSSHKPGICIILFLLVVWFMWDLLPDPRMKPLSREYDLSHLSKKKLQYVPL